MADADKERVAKLKADMPAVPKQAKAAAATKESKAPAKEAKAAKAPRAKTAYLVSTDLSCRLNQVRCACASWWCQMLLDFVCHMIPCLVSCLEQSTLCTIQAESKIATLHTKITALWLTRQSC